MKRLPLVALSLLALSTPAFAQQSKPEDFKEFCKVMEGRWLIDSTLNGDLPGYGKDGDKLTGHSEWKLDAEGHALVLRYNAGPVLGLMMLGYNPADKQITGLWIDTVGGHGKVTFYKRGESWMEKFVGAMPDGPTYESECIVTISEGGNKQIFAGPVKVGGKSAGQRSDTYTRIKK